MGAYIWAWLFLAYVKFVMCVRDMWVAQWYCVLEGLVEMRELVGMELYWKLIAKVVGLVCDVVTGFQQGCFYWMLVIESNSVNSGTEVLIGNVCIKVTRPSFFGRVPSYFEALWYPHLYFYRKSNT